MTGKRAFDDPDYGPVEVPDARFPTEREVAARRTRLASILAQRLWTAGQVYACPSCRKRALVGREDLVEEVYRPGQVRSFHHLRGAKCAACNVQFLEPSEIVGIEREVGVGMTPDFEAKVSNIGSGTLGTYWPKDVVRNMGLSPQKKAFIRVLDRDTALVKFVRSTASQKGTKRPKPS